MQNKIFNNAKWIIVCKVIQSLIQFAVGVFTARYLGPSNYGLINYAAAVVAFFAPVMQLGMSSTMVQEYVTRPNDEGKVMGTSLAMNAVSAIVCMIGVAAFAAIANPDDPVAITVCILYSISLLVQSMEMLQYWFQAKLLSKYSSVALLCAYVAVSAYKIYLLVSSKSVYWFALSYTVEYGVTGILLLIVYHRIGTQKLQISVSLAKELFAKSKYYIMAMLMVVVYNRVANVLLTWMIDETANGYYAAAVTCISIPSFVFMAIIDTARPVVLESLARSHDSFERNVSRVYGLITWLSAAQSVVFTVLAGLIIRMLYGEAFLPAVPILQIMVWNTAFSYMGYIRNIWILGEEKHSYLWIINLSGAVASLILNFALIPLWGACGAAAASVLVQLFTNVVMGFILKPIRRNNYLLLKGLNPKLLVEMSKELLRNRSMNA